MSNHTPDTDLMRQWHVLADHSGNKSTEEYEAEFDRWLATVEAAAEQRGAERAFRKTQEIIAGFDHTVDEARGRGDMINAGYLIIELDAEIQDLMEGDDEEH